MKVARVAELVASTLRQDIVSGDLGDGDRLPTLDRLVDRFQVSPASIREAMRILETEGLISVQRGKVGGAKVHRPRADRAAYMLGLVLESERVRVNDLTAALLELELACASCCANRSDRANSVVPILRDALGAAGSADDLELFGAGLVAFHSAITAECGNSTLVLTVGALGELWSEQALPWPHRVFDTQLDAAARKRIVAAYREVLAAIEAGDPSEAARRLRLILADPDPSTISRRRNPVLRAAQHTPQRSR
jgi:GntR family transcriptional regulator, transcriptional repressor for pyruvate dehydrogenase complex